MPNDLAGAVVLDGSSYDLDALKAQRPFLANEPKTNVDGLPCPPDLWDRCWDWAVAKFGEATAKTLAGDVAKPVTARFFVLHDTAGTAEYGVGTGLTQPSAAGKGIHLWLSAKASYQQLDWHLPGYGTKMESRAANRHFLHVEMSRDPALLEQVTIYNLGQYQRLACAYLFACARAKRFITVTAHNEVDRAVAYYDDAAQVFKDYGHADPEKFALGSWYKIVTDIADLPGDTTFGIEASRVNGKNMGGQRNVFIAFVKGTVDHAAQYGPVPWITPANTDKALHKKVRHPSYGEYYDLPITVTQNGKPVLPRDA
jgi:hypothetical protein